MDRGEKNKYVTVKNPDKYTTSAKKSRLTSITTGHVGCMNS